MFRRLLLVAIVLFCCSENIFAGGYFFSYTPLCHKAYQCYTALRIEEGNEAIRQEMRTNPNNLAATYIADYADCLILLLNGSQADYEQLHPHLARRLELLDEGDPNSPWLRLYEGGLYMHWAFVHVRMGDKLKAANTFRKSFLLLKENQKKFPDFEYNNILFGLEEAVVGTLPDDYSWIAAIFGLRGNVKKGVAKLESFISKHNAQDQMYCDALVFYTYVKFYLESRQEETWRFINSNAFPAQNNLLLSYVKTDIALNYRKADNAIQTLKNAQTLEAYNKFPIFDYQAGCALLHKLDAGSLSYFRHFLNTYKGNIFIKDALQKMAFSYYLQGDMAHANECRQKILTQGNASADGDRQAQRFAENNKWPMTVLLQARLLIEGGYYNQALSVLAGKSETVFTSVADKAEYNFRLGKAYDELGEDNKALGYYKRTIDIGKDDKSQFAARSSLQIGRIYEKNNNKQAALQCYNACLDMPVQDFKNSIKQQAKAGINRLTVQ
ncbi:MAG: tetratricopeptide repeat protein [Bacteroidetes bacterium]|nr:tetratricopeptide repeat protein [Bacteroidota bacterium]